MKILYAGFPKTGTKTMIEALRILGYKTYDFQEHFTYHAKEWGHILGEEKADIDLFRKMFKDVDVAADGAIYVFWKEILEAFPECKFIVNYRDSESWLKSFKNQNKIVKESLFLKLVMLLSPTGMKFGRFSRLVNCTIYGGTGCYLPWHCFQGINFVLLKKKYLQHNLQIQNEMPKDKLLVIDYSKGWTELCEFLDKPIPEVPFPHENKNGEVFNKRMDSHPFFLKCFKEACITFSLIVVIFSSIMYILYNHH